MGTFQNARFPLTVDGSAPTGMLDGTTDGTWPRKQGDRLGGWVRDVRDFGAKGDSNIGASTGTDDTAAIQAAVDSIESQGGGIIFFPPGTYKVTEPITFDSNVVKYIFRGVGNARASGGEAGGSCVVGNFAGFIFDRNVPNTSGGKVIIEDLGIRNASTDSDGGCVRLLGTLTSRVSNCSMQGANGVRIGAGIAQPASATFTGNSSGTTLTATSVAGTIAPTSFPCPISDSGTAVPDDTVILSQSSGTPGGAGDYITDVATTCSGETVTTHPNAPTGFNNVVEHCNINGLGSYNADPDLSFTGTGVHCGTNSFVRECHINSWRTAIAGYGAQGGGVFRCQMESNTYGIILGRDVDFNSFAATGLTLSDLSFESNYIAIYLAYAAQVSIKGSQIQVSVDGSHNSLHGIQIGIGTDIKIDTTIVTGTLDTGGFGLYFAGGGESRRIRVDTCDLKSIGRVDTSIVYSCITAAQAKGLTSVALSCTLAQLNTAITAGDVVRGERRLINDADTALGSQTYGAAVTGGGSALANVWWDGTTVRYG
jgi:hypothetical protein